MKTNIAALLTSLFLLTGTALTAQPQNVQKRPLYQEFRAYYEKNVKPVLLEQQEKFMSALTPQEKEELEQIKEQWKTVHESMRGTVPPEDRKNTQKAHFAAFNSQVEQIADAHPAEKERYIKEMTPKKKQWQHDLAALRKENNLPENNKITYLDRVDDPAFILMWDRNRTMQKHNMTGKKQNIQSQQNMQPAIRVFPQPASVTASVKITGMKNKMVTAGVYNASGKKVKDLFHAKSTIPVLSFTFDVSSWQNGIYTVKTTFGNRNMTMDFKVEK